MSCSPRGRIRHRCRFYRPGRDVWPAAPESTRFRLKDSSSRCRERRAIAPGSACSSTLRRTRPTARRRESRSADSRTSSAPITATTSPATTARIFSARCTAAVHGATTSGPDRIDGKGGIDTLFIDYSRDDSPAYSGITSAAGAASIRILRTPHAGCRNLVFTIRSSSPRSSNITSSARAGTTRSRRATSASTTS